MDLAWLSLVALVVVVAVSCTSRVNSGIVAIGMAWLIVLCGGHLLDPKLDYKVLTANFPGELFLTLLGVSLLFAQTEANGTLALVASFAQRLCFGNRGLIPILFFCFAAGLGSIGPGNIAVAGMLAPVAMAAATRIKISPLLMALMVGHGAIASTVSPFTAAGALANNILKRDTGLVGHEAEMFGYNAAANALAALIGFSIFGGWQLLLNRAAVNEPSSAEPDTKPPVIVERLTRQHVFTMIVIAMLLAAVVKYQIPIGMGAFLGAAVLAITGAADEKEALAKIPWSVIVMVCGVSVLTFVLDKTGGTKLFAALVDRYSTPSTACPIVAGVTGIVSVYSSTTGVVLPAFLPMVKDLAKAETGVPALSLALSVLVGGNLVDMSPLSTIGALCLAGHPDPASRRLLFHQLLIWGFAMAGLGASLCWLWFG